MTWITRGNPGGKITPVNLNVVKASLAGKAGKCIWVPFTQRQHQCRKLNGDSIQPGWQLWARFDGVNARVVRRMRERSKDGANGLGTINWFGPNNLAVLARFADLVREGGPWDIKHELNNEWGRGRLFWTAVRDDPAPERLRSDLWGLIHYAYVGRAHGISELALWIGNGCCGGAQGPDDDLALRIGLDLWRDFRFDITTTRLRLAVLRAMPRFRRFDTDAVRTPLRP